MCQPLRHIGCGNESIKCYCILKIICKLLLNFPTVYRNKQIKKMYGLKNSICTFIIGGVVLTAVLWIRIRIRIHWIHVFLGLLDPDPDPLVRGMDPDPDPDLDPSNIKPK